MNEKWRDIAGYEGLYAISSRGRVKRIAGGCGAKIGRILKTSKRRGYVHLSLYRKQVQDTRKAHQLVAQAFLGPKPSERHEVNHLNGIRDDNRFENLEWCTRSENLLHAYHVLGTMKRPEAPKGEQSGGARLTLAEVGDIRALYEGGGITYQKLGEQFGVNLSTIGYIVRGDTWKG